jgi:hypothetical protein
VAEKKAPNRKFIEIIEIMGMKITTQNLKK